ncbi:uncharacterized protein F5Z01DRAFT_671509 [Emericellopsis atlantica]|uniref:Uncharacterized protein n=1 Tax=Emericellopsis atlantica TaxID=2614577 RepID=A0A9P7ZSM2_9HYPO|nr:uncharacterized protein F5Z01DRAFT_671509 [Emericellopsis atlantica]KAG9257061.1 hypothetical protein F5Z01DRAFT_671509 [Emericellopsis atlantica]
MAAIANSGLEQRQIISDPAEISDFFRDPFGTGKATKTEAVSQDDGKEETKTDSEGQDTVVTEKSTITDGLTTKTDSGRTITVPNNEVVTITRHTTIVTNRPQPSSNTSSDATSAATGPITEGPSVTTGSPTETPGLDESHDGGFPMGAIVGGAVSSALLVVVAVIAMIVLKRRSRRRRDDTQSSLSSNDQYKRTDRFDDKHFPQRQRSAHTADTAQTTATGVGDPFAPFGGRVDKDSECPIRPQSNTFEMDATTAVPAELPDSSAFAANPTTTVRAPVPVEPAAPAQPGANLDPLETGQGKPKYINHWDQYRAMGSAQEDKE